MDNYNQNYLVIGGSVSGLSAAIRLAELGQEVAVIDSSPIPSNKVCGEFISHEAHDILNEWGVKLPITVATANIYAHENKFHYPLPLVAKCIKRINLEQALIDKAKALGVKIYAGDPIVEFIQPTTINPSYQIKTQQNRYFTPSHLIIAAGRFYSPNRQPPKFEFIGLKQHVSYDWVNPQLDMYTFLHGYMGIVPVEPGVVNMACLVKKPYFESFNSLDDFLNKIKTYYPNSLLKDCLTKAQTTANPWLIVKAPKFGQKKTPNWKNAYFVGDAAASLYPATGDGLGSAITSGVLAGIYAANQEPKAFQKAWEQQFKTRIFWGTQLHQILSSPTLMNVGLSLSKQMPKIPDFFFRKTRGESV